MLAHANASPPTLRAEILAIGTELLLGEILDTNTRVIARALRETGIDLFRTTTVGDNADRIAEALRDCLQRADVVITTGGLGPTIDDVTRAGIARAFRVELKYHSELWLQIEERFRRFHRTPTENNRRQAMLPEHAQAIDNPIGTAPGFILAQQAKTVIALPGVPAEMVCLLEQRVIPYLKAHSREKAVILPRLLHLAGVGESWVDERIRDLEASANPTVGLAAHPGQVDIRITAKATTTEAAMDMLDAMESTLRDRLGDAIFGIDEESLSATVSQHLRNTDVKLLLVENGTNDCVAAALGERLDDLIQVDHQDCPENDADIDALLRARLAEDGRLGAAFCISLDKKGDRFQLRLRLQTRNGTHQRVRYFGGADTLACQWATQTALDFLRRIRDW